MQHDLIDQVADQWARELPGLPLESIGVVGRILRIAKVISDERRRVLAGLEIDVATFDLLATLRRSGPPYRMTPAQLSESTLVTAGATTQRVDRAEADGFVQVHRTSSGRRTISIELTARGRLRIDRDIDVMVRREHDLINHLAARDREQLVDLLRRLLSGLPDAHS
jgi:DNA-binding MarR family transcriptional regulator